MSTDISGQEAFDNIVDRLIRSETDASRERTGNSAIRGQLEAEIKELKRDKAALQNRIVELTLAAQPGIAPRGKPTDEIPF